MALEQDPIVDSFHYGLGFYYTHRLCFFFSLKIGLKFETRLYQKPIGVLTYGKE